LPAPGRGVVQRLHFVEECRHLLNLVDEDGAMPCPDLFFGLQPELCRILGVAQERVVLEQVDRP